MHTVVTNWDMANYRKNRNVEAKLELANRQVEQLKAQRNLLQSQKDDQTHRVAGDNVRPTCGGAIINVDAKPVYCKRIHHLLRKG